MAEFEITTPTHPPLTGALHVEVYEGDHLSNNIIRIDQDVTIKFHWRLEGPLTRCICGTWCLNVFFESIGPGPEIRLPGYAQGKHIPVDPCGDGKYWDDFVIPAGTLGAEHCSTPYKLVAALTYLTPCDDPGPMAGFCELPVIQFYESVK